MTERILLAGFLLAFICIIAVREAVMAAGWIQIINQLLK